MVPATSIIPAKPAKPPDNKKQNQTIFACEKPAKAPALGAAPITLTSKPLMVRVMTQ